MLFFYIPTACVFFCTFVCCWAFVLKWIIHSVLVLKNACVLLCFFVSVVWQTLRCFFEVKNLLSVFTAIYFVWLHLFWCFFTLCLLCCQHIGVFFSCEVYEVFVVRHLSCFFGIEMPLFLFWCQLFFFLLQSKKVFVIISWSMFIFVCIQKMWKWRLVVTQTADDIWVLKKKQLIRIY